MKTIKNQLGFSVPELVGALAAVMILGLIASEVILDASRKTQMQRTSLIRDEIAIAIRSSAGNIIALQNTVKQPENAAIKNCICGLGTCQSALPYDFTLYDNNPTNPVKVPLTFNASGLPCDPSVTNCLLQISLSFIAQCMPYPFPSSNPAPPLNCNGRPAEFFGISFKVEQNPLAVSQGILLKPINGVVFTSVAALGAGVCL